MELVKGRWYKNLGVMKDHIGKFSGWYDSEIISVSEYIYEDELRGPSECFTKDYKFAKEIPLSEIQQYLPYGHPDKEFILPEKWCVKINSKHEGLILAEWANYGWYVRHGDGVNFINSIKGWSKTFDCNYTEITFEQFKKNILKTKEMKEKEIIGYKLKDNKYTKNVKALLNAPEFDFQEFKDNRFKFTIALKELRGAGVLDLWFEPIFKEKFKVGDWVMETLASSPYYNLKAFRIIRINDEIATYDRQGECKTTLSDLRLATPEEIKKTLVEEAIKRGFTKGIKFKFKEQGYGKSIIEAEVRSLEAEHYKNNGIGWRVISTSSGVVYSDKYGWAEILPNYPQIEINGYKCEFFDWGVKFGCQKYEKEFVIKLAECIKQNGFKMDYKASVIQIADYYLNKK